MRTNASRGRVRLPPALSFALVVVLAALVAGCESAPDEADRTPGPPSLTATAGSATASPSPSPTPPPAATSTASPTPTATRDPAASSGQQGAVAVAVEDGSRAVLHQGTDPWLVVDAHRPGLTAGGTAVWTGVTAEGSRRFGLDGEVTDIAPGWGLTESADARSRAYLVGGADFRTAATVVVEREGAPVFEGQTAGWNPRMVFSPDGMRFAWIDWSVGEGVGDLKVLDLATGDVRTVATGLGHCQCDVPQHTTWSPSGAYLAYQTVRQSVRDPGEYGVVVINLDRGDETLVEAADLRPDSWVSIDSVEWLLTVGPDNRVLLTAPETGEERELARIPAASVSAFVENSLVEVRTDSGRDDHQTLLFDPASGERLVLLDGEGDAVLTPDGLATAVITRTELACTGLDIKHPAYEAQLPCDVADARWSPDGRYLALLPVQEGAPLRILDTTTGIQREIDRPPFGDLPQWSSDSRHVLWVWGGGP